MSKHINIPIMQKVLRQDCKSRVFGIEKNDEYMSGFDYIILNDTNDLKPGHVAFLNDVPLRIQSIHDFKIWVTHLDSSKPHFKEHISVNNQKQYGGDILTITE